MPAEWSKYGAQDERETNTLRGKLNDVQNKLLTIKNVENPVNSDERNNRIAKIEEGMKNMFVNGNNAINDLYSKFDNIGDFSNKSNFRNPVKEQQKKQSQPIYIEKENIEPKKKTAGRPIQNLTEEEKKKIISERNKIYRENAKAKKDKANKEIEESELKNASFKERIDKSRTKLKEQQQDADETYNYQMAYLNEVKDTSTEKEFI